MIILQRNSIQKKTIQVHDDVESSVAGYRMTKYIDAPVTNNDSDDEPITDNDTSISSANETTGDKECLADLFDLSGEIV